MGNSESTVALPARKRPLSVWLLALLNGLLAILLIATYFKGDDWGIPAGQSTFWGLLGLGISLAAHTMWFGSRIGRNLLLALITVYFALLLAQNLRDIAWASDYNGSENYILIEGARALFGLVWLFVNYWYLLGGRARSFFA